MNTILIIIGSNIICFILGYQFCKSRWRVKALLKALQTITAFYNGEITVEEALKIYREICPDKDDKKYM